MDTKDLSQIEKIGFRVEAHKRDGINGLMKKIIMDNIPDISALICLFHVLESFYTINFWDASHKQISDPGAYCTGVIINKEIASYMEGNHGWTSDWKEMSIEDFAKFTQQNWDKDIDWGEYLNCIIIEDNKYSLPR